MSADAGAHALRVSQSLPVIFSLCLAHTLGLSHCLTLPLTFCTHALPLSISLSRSASLDLTLLVSHCLALSHTLTSPCSTSLSLTLSCPISLRPQAEALNQLIAGNEVLREALSKTTTVANVVLLRPCGQTAEPCVCVVNNHFFGDPAAPHIRLIQAALVVPTPSHPQYPSCIKPHKSALSASSAVVIHHLQAVLGTTVYLFPFVCFNCLDCHCRSLHVSYFFDVGSLACLTSSSIIVDSDDKNKFCTR